LRGEITKNGIVTIPIEIKCFGKRAAILRNALAFTFLYIVAIVVGVVLIESHHLSPLNFLHTSVILTPCPEKSVSKYQYILVAYANIPNNRRLVFYLGGEIDVF